MMKLLIKAGANIDELSDDMTPVMWACCQQNLDILIYLVKEVGSSLTKIGDPDNLYGSPMHLVCLMDNVELLTYLCNEKDALDKEYNPLIMVSATVNYGGNGCLHVCGRQGAK